MQITQKSPDNPEDDVITGPIISDNMNARPIWNPTKALAFARLCSETESAKKAINTAEIAPPPWSARPITTKIMSVELADNILPIKKIHKPKNNSGFRPYISDK